MLLTNFVAAINAYFAGLFLFTVILLLTGILLMWNLANSMDRQCFCRQDMFWADGIAKQ